MVGSASLKSPLRRIWPRTERTARSAGRVARLGRRCRLGGWASVTSRRSPRGRRSPPQPELILKRGHESTVIDRSAPEFGPERLRSVAVTVVGATAVLVGCALRIFTLPVAVALLLVVALLLAFALLLGPAVLLAVAFLLAAASRVAFRGRVGVLQGVAAVTGVRGRLAGWGRLRGRCGRGWLGEVGGDAGDRGEYPVGLVGGDPALIPGRGGLGGECVEVVARLGVVPGGDRLINLGQLGAKCGDELTRRRGGAARRGREDGRRGHRESWSDHPFTASCRSRRSSVSCVGNPAGRSEVAVWRAGLSVRTATRSAARTATIAAAIITCRFGRRVMIEVDCWSAELACWSSRV